MRHPGKLLFRVGYLSCPEGDDPDMEKSSDRGFWRKTEGNVRWTLESLKK